MRKVQRMRKEGKNQRPKGSLPKVATARRAVRLFAWKGGTGVPPVYVGKRNNLIDRLGAPLQHTAGTAMPHSQTTGAAAPPKWDACGEASLPILFERRCRADLAYGAARRFKHGADGASPSSCFIHTSLRVLRVLCGQSLALQTTFKNFTRKTCKLGINSQFVWND